MKDQPVFEEACFVSPSGLTRRIALAAADGVDSTCRLLSHANFIIPKGGEAVAAPTESNDLFRTFEEGGQGVGGETVSLEFLEQCSV